MPIRALPPEVASQIAAGEVVERPASVIKELIENALDARARNILVEVEAAGRRLIRVSDDGEGIPAGEIALSIARHATSKLENAADLERIRTLGFRGEALASIAAVSRFSITSRTEASDQGVRLSVEGGRSAAPSTVGAPAGTVVQMEDLFFNVPARMKFLKSETAERRYIASLTARFALAYPQVRFKLLLDGETVLQSSGSGDSREALSRVFGLDTAAQMLEIFFPAEEDITVEGFVSPLSLSRGNRKDILLHINGRLISDAGLTAAVVQAYHTMLMVGRFPLAAVFLSLPPEEVDVNVHPAKAEVRFRRTDAVFSAVQRAVRQTLITQSPVHPVAPPSWPHRNVEAQMSPHAWPTEQTFGGVPQAQDAASVPTQPLPSSERIPLLRVIGQIGLAYLVAEGPDGLYLIDQHAAHERVLFDALRRQAAAHAVSQTLLTPELVEVSGVQAAVLAGNLERLSAIGFTVEPFGATAFRIRAIPELLAKLPPRDALLAVVEDFEEDETPLEAEAEARLTARICKRAAVKAGQTLGAEEQAALVRALEKSESPRTCPHGRPTMIHLSVGLLERQFGRRG